MGDTEKVHDIGRSFGLGTTRDILLLKPSTDGTINTCGDIHLVRAAERQGSIFVYPKAVTAYPFNTGELLPIKLMSILMLQIGTLQRNCCLKEYPFYIANFSFLVCFFMS